MKKLGLLFISSIAILTSCSTAKDTVRMTVASEKADCMGVAPMKCLQVKEGKALNWSLFYTPISGFNHEAGYEYVLDVKKEAVAAPIPADRSSVKYTLIKEVSKTKKNSENMSAGIPSTPKYVWTARVISIEDADVGTRGAKGRFPVKVVKSEVTALNAANMPFKAGAIIHSELLSNPKVMPKVGGEYIFKAKNTHPAHALGVYMLDTDVQDLVN